MNKFLDKISTPLYHLVFKRSSTFSLAVVIGAMFFERAFDHMCEAIFEYHNEGRLWMHIKHNYEQGMHDAAPPQPEETNEENE